MYISRYIREKTRRRRHEDSCSRKGRLQYVLEGAKCIPNRSRSTKYRPRNCIPACTTCASGVTVADVCKTTYEEIKKDKKHRYVIFYIKDEKQIDVEVIGPRDAAYDAFLEDLQKGGSGECRYGLFDFEYTHQCQGTSEASKKQKLFLMSWCPDTAKVKKKMLYSSSFDALKKSLVGVQKYIQATDLSEASEEAVEEKLRATDRN
ncbi:cofilin/actin-depolymerizing factor homolog isoform X1 [Vespula pensylvanica]|uniref:cofilin/actin-depolymerizing factor homolog isoform X1 n=1 Tax=Vespula pensylvanica TaxID=30213 RepID=UPI001CBA4C31|nr:cofilin/actin-depolymerizing factor homolog isoform X1 [Vespula pensylvanica]XP_050864618.1 cofilin/actin-depolymerizing factor homolog isoform X1 [Vespula vulgaris]